MHGFVMDHILSYNMPYIHNCNAIILVTLYNNVIGDDDDGKTSLEQLLKFTTGLNCVSPMGLSELISVSFLSNHSSSMLTKADAVLESSNCLLFILQERFFLKRWILVYCIA